MTVPLTTTPQGPSRGASHCEVQAAAFTLQEDIKGPILQSAAPAHGGRGKD